MKTTLTIDEYNDMGYEGIITYLEDATKFLWENKTETIRIGRFVLNIKGAFLRLTLEGTGILATWKMYIFYMENKNIPYLVRSIEALI